MAVTASRSSLVGVLIRTSPFSCQTTALNFLLGLSTDELECLAEFQGSCILEAAEGRGEVNPYRLLSLFFDPAVSDRWRNPAHRAHKTFVVISWLEILRGVVHGVAAEAATARAI